MRFYNINFLKLCSFIPPDLLTSVLVTLFTKFGGTGQSLLPQSNHSSSTSHSWSVHIPCLAECHHQHPSAQIRNLVFILDSSHGPFVFAHQVLLIPTNYLSNLPPELLLKCLSPIQSSPIQYRWWDLYFQSHHLFPYLPSTYSILLNSLLLLSICCFLFL